MRQLQNLFGAAILFVTALTLSGCGFNDNALEEIINGGGGSVTAATLSFDEPATLSMGTLQGKLKLKLTNTGTSEVTYSSSDPSVATIDPTTGEITAVAAGETIIKATVSDNSYDKNEASCTLQVYAGLNYLAWDGTAIAETNTLTGNVLTGAISASDLSLTEKNIITGETTIDEDIIKNGTLHIILCDNATLTVNGCINDDTSPGLTLSIYAQSKGDQKGKLYVTKENDAAIGDVGGGIERVDIHGGYMEFKSHGTTTCGCGINGSDVNIYDGEILAQGHCAGGNTDDGIRITGGLNIYGGKVTAIGGENNNTTGSLAGGTGIHHTSSSVKILISGDETVVIANGGKSSVGNGGAGISASNDIEISGHAKVTTTGGDSDVAEGGRGVWLGSAHYFKTSGNATIKATGGNSSGTSNGGNGIYAKLTATGTGSIEATGGNAKGTGDGGPGISTSTVTINGFSLLAEGGNGGETGNGGHGINVTTGLDFNSGSFLSKGGAKGTSGTSNGQAINGTFDFDIDFLNAGHPIKGSDDDPDDPETVIPNTGTNIFRYIKVE